MDKKHWWKIAFSEIYFNAFDEIYSIKRGEKETLFLINALKMKKGSRILDLACGQGRHAISFAQHGMNVAGVDASASLLKVAKQRARKAGVNIPFIKGDMRTYHNTVKYDFILVLGNSFGYFSDMDNEQVLSNISTSLKKGGLLVLDLPNSPGMLRHEIVGAWTQRIPGGKLTTHMISFNPKTFQIAMQWRILQNKKKTSFNGMLRLYTPPEINHLLIERNLSVKKIYGSFADEPYNIKTSRCLVIAQKISSRNNKKRITF